MQSLLEDAAWANSKGATSAGHRSHPANVVITEPQAAVAFVVLSYVWAWVFDCAWLRSGVLCSRQQSGGAWCSQIARARGTRMRQLRTHHSWTKLFGEEFVSSDFHEQAPSKRRHHVSRGIRGSVESSGVSSVPKAAAIASRMHDGTVRIICPLELAFAKATRRPFVVLFLSCGNTGDGTKQQTRTSGVR